MPDDTEVAPAADPAAAELQPGAEIAGYVVEAKIAEGGMGKIYGAHQPRIGKRVAIKVLERSYCDDASAVARFEQEARLVNEIHHPNIVDVFQFGELPDGRSFFIMEWLAGETLTERIDTGPLSTDEAIAILDTICDALEAAHEHGVVHRDLKSDNVFLASSRGKRTVKLLDFGIAKLARRNDLSSIGKTASGMVVGTPAYMSPEQARGQTIGPWTDVYQLGILAYKMLTGELPFDAENPFELVVAQLKAPPPSPKKLAPKTPDVLARLVVRMLAKVPDERPSIAEVRGVCARLLEAETTPRAPRRGMAPVVLGATLLVASVVSIAAWLWSREQGSAAPAALPATAGSSTTPAPAPTPPAPPPPAPTPAPPVPASEPAIPIETKPAPAVTADKAKKRSRGSSPADAAQDTGVIQLTLEVASRIEIDGEVVAPSSRGGRFEVSPGTHKVSVTAPEQEPVTSSVDVPAGGVTVVSITGDQAEM